MTVKHYLVKHNACASINIKVFVLIKEVAMFTNLEPEWQESRNVRTLFHELTTISESSPITAFKEIKHNRKVGGATLAELVDAAWWCLYSLLYSTEEDRNNAQPHNDYFYNEENFKKDAEMLLKCELMRLETGTHRYPLPKRGNNSTSKKKIKRFNEYKDFLIQTTMRMLANDTPTMMQTPEAYKMTIDMIRCSQERLLGNEPDDVTNARKEQFICIGNLVDDVFIHRGYVRKVQGEEAELLTPEQLDEWETAKSRIKQHCDDGNNTIHGFVRAMVNVPSFILEPIS